MTILRVIDIHKKYLDREILKGISFHIEQGEILALVGDNGAGKTTMANIIAGNLDYENGQLIWQRDELKIGFLHQATFYDEGDFLEAIKEETDSRKFFEFSKKLGLNHLKEWEADQLNNLSGGERTKIILSKILSEKPSFLILDEPTNHMDYKGVKWLIKTLKAYQGTTLLISHDRYFMDQCADRIVEIEDGLATSYDGNYTYYRELKRKIYEDQLHQYREQEKYKRKIESDINQLKTWSDKGHRESTKKEGLKEKYRKRAQKKDQQVKSRIKRLEKIDLEGVKKPKEEQNIYFKFGGNQKGGDILLEAMGVEKSFNGNVVFKESDFYIKRGEKVAVYGPNGCGKTTLIKGIMGNLDLGGKLHVSDASKIAYLSQEVLDMVDSETVLESFEFTSNDHRGYVRIVLDNLGFHGELLNKKISMLSLGERTRLKLAHMMIEDNSLLILDEPTNHLDLHSREMLEETIDQYQGTVIVVSHDRYFLERVCDMVLVFENMEIKRLEMTFKEFVEKNEVNQKKKQGKNKKNIDERKIKEQILVYDAKMASILSDFSGLAPDSEPYNELESKYQEIIREKKLLEDQLN